MKCPELFRVSNGIEPSGVWSPPDLGRVETDAAVVGTVLHSVIEADLTEPFPTVNEALQFGQHTLAELIVSFAQNEIEYRTETFGDDPTKCLAALDALVQQWWDSGERDYWLMLIGEHPNDILLEYEFDVPFLKLDSYTHFKEVRLAGTMDVLDKVNHRVVDWKSAGRDYQRWEKQRWAPQPTVYLYAAAEQNLIQRHEEGYKFEYRVFTRGKHKVQDLTVWRETGQWGWLAQICTNIVKMWESSATEWPLRDDHALCGPKWCPKWSECKGAFVDEEWK
jgi:hypothetical protein